MRNCWTEDSVVSFASVRGAFISFTQGRLDSITVTDKQLRQMFEEVESNADAWAGALEEAIDEMAGPASDSIMERAVEIFENGI